MTWEQLECELTEHLRSESSIIEDELTCQECGGPLILKRKLDRLIRKTHNAHEFLARIQTLQCVCCGATNSSPRSASPALSS